MTLAQKKERLLAQVGDRRYTHSLSVADTARQLAVTHGEDPECAYIAGLLHDCAKNFSNDELLEVAQRAGIEVDFLQEAIPHLLHGQVGAYIAKEQYGVDDPGVLRAIAVHVYGALERTLLDTIVMLADAIEPGRKTQGVEICRELAQTDLDAALLHYTSHLLSHLATKQYIIYPTTLSLYNDLLLKNRRSKDDNT